MDENSNNSQITTGDPKEVKRWAVRRCRKKQKQEREQVEENINKLKKENMKVEGVIEGLKCAAEIIKEKLLQLNNSDAMRERIEAVMNS